MKTSQTTTEKAISNFELAYRKIMDLMRSGDKETQAIAIQLVVKKDETKIIEWHKANIGKMGRFDSWYYCHLLRSHISNYVYANVI